MNSLRVKAHNQRELAQEVQGITEELVHHALDGAWVELFDGVERRRALLEVMRACARREDHGVLKALTAAVSESEQAVACVIAHVAVRARAPAGKLMWH